MRTVVSVLLACLFVVVATADPFACPDGCTDEAPHAVSPCALCHGWRQPPVVVTSRPASPLLARQPAVTTTPADPALATIEPPPKAT